jgi:hypothetical protein
MLKIQGNFTFSGKIYAIMLLMRGFGCKNRHFRGFSPAKKIPKTIFDPG